jgi:hypothetical protein
MANVFVTVGVSLAAMRHKASRDEVALMAGKTIGTNLRLRLKGWKAAASSKKTPATLRKAIRNNIRELRARLR